MKPVIRIKKISQSSFVQFIIPHRIFLQVFLETKKETKSHAAKIKKIHIEYSFKSSEISNMVYLQKSFKIYAAKSTYTSLHINYF